MEEFFDLTTLSPLSLSNLAINLLLSIVLSGLVSWFYFKYGRSLTNRAKLARIMPILALVIVLIISIVKSSLALSLGLVGALSIVRFRTAIKEPEELVYLFLTIGIGLGLGADQRWATVMAIGIVLLFLAGQLMLAPQSAKNNLYFNISTPNGDDVFSSLTDLLNTHVTSADLRRVDQTAELLQATYLIDSPKDGTLANLMAQLKEKFPQSEISFVEQDSSLGG